jgi:hypothetical protein
MTGSNTERSASATAIHHSTSCRVPGLHRAVSRAVRQRHQTASPHPQATAMVMARAGPAATDPSLRRGAR